MTILRAMVLTFLLAGSAAAGPWHLEIGPVAGAVALDPALADYRWDTQPSLQSGLETSVGQGRWRVGLRYLHSETTQATGLGGDYTDPTVKLTNAEVVARYELARPLGIEVWASGHAGLMHLGYTPDQLAFEPGGGGGTVTVDYEPLTEPALGGGLALSRGLGRSWAVALAADASTFALDTAHRRGDEIVQQRERFWNWSARLVVAWRTTLN